MANYQNASNRNSSNKLVAPGAQAAIDQMKFEIASEFGVNLDQMQQLVRTDLLVAKSQNV